MPKREGTKQTRPLETCKDATNLILDYLTGDLSGDKQDEFERHLDECPDCVAFLNTYKKTLELTKAFLNKK